MPVAPALLPAPVLDRLAVTVTGGTHQPPPPTSLLAVFSQVPDPRKHRGRRHSLAVVLTLATCAVLAGARSFTAIGEGSADDGQAATDVLVVVRVPDESTFRRGCSPRGRRRAGCGAGSVGRLFPHAVQVTRRSQPLVGGPATTEVVYLVTSLPTHQAGPTLLAAFAREHWLVEDRQHYVRDVTFGEGQSQVRTGNAPQVMASLRNLVIAILRLTGVTNIAQGIRHHARRPERPLETIKSFAC